MRNDQNGLLRGPDVQEPQNHKLSSTVGGSQKKFQQAKSTVFLNLFLTNQIVLLKRQLHALITAIEKEEIKMRPFLSIITIQPCIYSYTIDFYYKYKPVISIYFKLLQFRIA